MDSGCSRSGPAGATGLYWAPVPVLPQHRQIACLRTRNRRRGPAGDRLGREVGENNGTQATRIDGDNVSAYRKRVERVRDDGG